MRGNGIRQTHNGTGGTGTLTLVAVSGWPAFSNVFTGVRYVDYEIDEYTNASKTVLAQQECGEGSIDTSSGILTRTKVDSTWNGTTYLPNPGSATAPTALNITNTAANVDILCSPSAASMMSAVPFFYGAVGSVSDGLGCLPMNFGTVLNNSRTLTFGTVYYTPILIGHRGPFSQASVRALVGASGGTPTTNVAIYEVASDGSPGKKLIDFGNLGAPTSAVTLTSSAIGTPIALVPGWYWSGLLCVANSATGSPAFRGLSLTSGGPSGVLFANSAPLNTSLTLGSQTALNDPATAPTGSDNSATVPAMLFK